MQVAHVGLLGEQPGGMAQVVNGYLQWDSPLVQQHGILSARRAHDPAGPALTVRAFAQLLLFRRRSVAAGGRPVAVVHLSEGGSFVREGALLLWSRAIGMPVVAHLHGAVFESFAARRPRLVRAILSRADAIAVLTEPSRHVVQRIVGARIPVALVPNVVPDAVRELRSDPVVLFGGELSTRKGVDVLLAAWSRITARHPDWTLELAGPVARSFALPEQLPPRTRVLGPLPHDQLLDRLAAAAVAVLPSRDEALPMFLLEAMAHGCAPIGSDVGQVPQLLAGGAGVVTRHGDAESLAAALTAVIEQPERVRQIAAAAGARVHERYSTSRARDVLVDLWVDVAGA